MNGRLLPLRMAVRARLTDGFVVREAPSTAWRRRLRSGTVAPPPGTSGGTGGTEGAGLTTRSLGCDCRGAAPVGVDCRHPVFAALHRRLRDGSPARLAPGRQST